MIEVFLLVFYDRVSLSGNTLQRSHYYVTVQTITLVGFGDRVPTSTGGKVFAMALCVSSAVLFSSLIVLVADVAAQRTSIAAKQKVAALFLAFFSSLASLPLPSSSAHSLFLRLSASLLLLSPILVSCPPLPLHLPPSHFYFRSAFLAYSSPLLLSRTRSLLMIGGLIFVCVSNSP